MKKVIGLLCVATFATDLFASAIIPESTELTPKTLARAETIAEEQVAQYIRNEIDAVSRVPNKTEQEVTSRLAVAFEATMPAGDNIDEIRVFDTASFINGCYLNRTRKDELLSLSCERNEENIEELCNLLCKNVRFEDEALKAYVLNLVREGCESSPVFYRQMISYIARLEDFSHPLDRGLTEVARRNEIVRGDYSYSKYRKIGLSQGNDCGYSYFKLPSAQSLPSRLFAMMIKPQSVFFHEAGHTVDTVTHVLGICHLDQTIGMLAPAFLNTNLLNLTGLPFIEALKDTPISQDKTFDKVLTSYKIILTHSMQIRNNVAFFEKTAQELETALKHFVTTIITTKIAQINVADVWQMFGVLLLPREDGKFEKTAQELETALKHFVTTIITTKIAKISAADVWQMFGVLLLPREDGKKVLYINKNCDIALDVSVGMPFRATHDGSDKVELFSDAFPHLPYKMPEIYKPLVEALTDTTWGGYITRLIYPNGLLSGLQREYDLYKSRMHGVKRLIDDSQSEHDPLAPKTKTMRLLSDGQ